MMEYLKETQMLDYSHPNIQKLIYDKQWKQMIEFNRIQAIYNYVRDEILFGYNSDDYIPASKVLADGYGQCNTKGTLFMALLRACDIPCRIHGFTINKKLQKELRQVLYIIVHLRIYFTAGWKFTLKIDGTN